MCMLPNRHWGNAYKAQYFHHDYRSYKIWNSAKRERKISLVKEKYTWLTKVCNFESMNTISRTTYQVYNITLVLWGTESHEFENRWFIKCLKYPSEDQFICVAIGGKYE